MTESKKTCIFCRIVAGEAPADVVLQNDLALAVVPKEMEVFGHTLVIPKNHAVTTLDCSAEDLAAVMALINDVARLYQEKLGMTGFNLLSANGLSAEQSVPHLHFHLFPRFDGDGIQTWPVLPTPTKSKEDFLKLLREACSGEF